jgi:nucleotide-binding universal stress UspA family protein
MSQTVKDVAMELQTIVVAVDDTPAGLHALRAAAGLGEAARARVFALRIVEDPWTGVRPEEVGTLQRRGVAPAAVAESRLTEELQQTIATTVGTARAQPVVGFGIPGQEIASVATRLGADLLVLGRQPVGSLERRPAGRVLAETVRRARMPCLAVPFGQREWSGVLAVSTPGSAEAVKEAAATFARVWATQPTQVTLDTGVTGETVTRVLQLVRDNNCNVLVVPADQADRFIERAPCAVLAVPAPNVPSPR